MFKAIVGLILVVPMLVSAEEFSVVSVGIDAEEDLLFVVFDKDSSVSECASKAEFKWRLSDGHTYAIYSLALHAHKENVKVKVGTSIDCVDSQPTGKWIKLSH